MYSLSIKSSANRNFHKIHFSNHRSLQNIDTQAPLKKFIKLLNDWRTVESGKVQIENEIYEFMIPIELDYDVASCNRLNHRRLLSYQIYYGVVGALEMHSMKGNRSEVQNMLQRFCQVLMNICANGNCAISSFSLGDMINDSFSAV